MRNRLKKAWEWIKSEMKSGSIDDLLEKENEFIKRNEVLCLQILKDYGWTVLSTNERICFYSYRCLKDNQVHNFSQREVMKMANLDPEDYV